MIPLFIVEGPTATGKTALAVEIAKKINGEVVSADSMQIYKYMDIGSAKPTTEEMDGIPHHLIDITLPTVDFSLALYAEMAHKVIKEIYVRGKIPILTGGTGLYINTVMNNINLTDMEKNKEVSNELLKFAEKFGNKALHEKLEQIDKESAEAIHFNNVKRVIRAIEMFKTTGITKTKQVEQSKMQDKIYKTFEFGIEYDREKLYDRINRRVDIMIEKGLVDEVKKCIDIGCTRDNTSMQAIGYRQMLDYFDGICSLDETIYKIKQESRKYAKRQITWFKRNNICWLKPGEEINFDFLEEMKND